MAENAGSAPPNTRGPDMNAPAFDAIVVGGGIVGVAVASALQRGGRSTILLEKGGLGEAVTGASLACIGAHMIARNEIPALKWACEAWKRIDESTGRQMEYRRCGQLRFIRDDLEEKAARRWVSLERAHGLPSRLVDRREARDIEPLLTGPIRAATFSPHDAIVNPFLAVRVLVKAAVARGLSVRTGAPVDSLIERGGRIVGVATERDRIESPLVVLAAGPWTARIAATIGLALPISPRRAQCLATTALPPTIRTVVGACETEGGVAAGYTQIQQAASGQVLFNTVLGSEPERDAGPDRPGQPSPAFVRNSISTLIRLFPRLAHVSLLRSWVRYEAVTPDDAFIAGPTGPEGLWTAAGDGGTGFLRAPAIARLVADGVDGRSPPFPTTPYAPDRFPHSSHK